MGEIIVPYLSGRTDIDFLQTKQSIVHLKHYMWAFYLHIFSSLYVLLAGVTQFSRYFIVKYPKIHRWVGIGYVFVILFISAPGAWVMSYYANGNVVSRINFGLLTTLWWLFTFWAFTSIKKRKVVAHADWMIRSYALTLSAVTLRIYQYLLGYFHTYNPLGVVDTYVALSFISWIPNLLVAEWLIRQQGISKKILVGRVQK
ncbi:MAG: DUF2306 domain-containing protein [Thermonemataceae bacterium]